MRNAVQGRPWILGLVATLLLAAPASAGPITVWGQSGFGWDPTTITGAGGAQDMGATDLGGLPDGSMFVADPMGTKFDIVTPDPVPVLSHPTTPSRTNPVISEVTQWSFTANEDFRDLYVVFVGHEPTDVNPYDPANVGFRIDPMIAPWNTIQPDPTNFPDLWYLTYFVGDLEAGESFFLDVQYYVAEPLFPAPTPGDLQFPQFRIGYIANTSVPEPAVAMLFASGALLLAVRRRMS